jgi:hypothetical protein
MQLSHIGNSSQLVVVACLVHVEVMLCHLVQHGCFHDLCMIIVETRIDVPSLGMCITLLHGYYALSVARLEKVQAN